MDSANSSTATARNTSDDVEGGMKVGTSQRASSTKRLTTLPKRPWYKEPKVLALLALALAVGAGAGVGVAVALAISTGSTSDSSSSSSSQSGGGNTPTPGPSVTVGEPTTTLPVPETSSPTGKPTVALVTQAPIVPATDSPTGNPTQTPTSGLAQEAFSFYVMGDMPYSQKEAAVFKEQIEEMNLSAKENAVFTVHVGDMMNKNVADCQASHFQAARNILLEGPLPTMVLAGDNDWLDCSEPDRGWANYHDTFVTSPFEDQWLNSSLRTAPFPFEVQRNTNNPEMFSFVYNGVLFLSVSLWQNDMRYMDASMAWVEDEVESKFEEHDIRGVILFGHAKRVPNIKPFFIEVAKLFVDPVSKLYIREVPVLYLHGDGHKWNIETKFANDFWWFLYADVQVDQGINAPPVLVEVAEVTDSGGFVPLQVENQWQYLFGEGLFRIDRRGGRYDGQE